jgi:hypothetical protein
LIITKLSIEEPEKDAD